MSHAIDFFETSVFTKLIRATGGLRKIRMAVGNQGESGSVRVVYFLAHAEKIHLILAYPKDVKDSLTKSEKSEFKKLVKLLKGEDK